MRLAILLLAAIPSFGATCALNSSGNWATAGIWSCGHAPLATDTVSLEGFSVDVTDTRACGNSGISGIVVLNFGATGALHVRNGGHFQLRGDASWIGGDANTTPYLMVDGGGIFEFDSHLASSPSATKYSVSSDSSGWGARQLIALGSTSSYATITSNSGGGNGYFTTATVGGWYDLRWANISRIGDSTNAAFRVFWADPAHNQWISMYNHFDQCGLTPRVDNAISVDSVIKHNFNTHTNSLAAEVMLTGRSLIRSLLGPARLLGTCSTSSWTPD